MKPIKKINFKQPKFIFPLIIFLPLTFLAYEVCQLFTPNKPPQVNELNVSLPDAEERSTMDKVRAMERIRRQDEENITGIMKLDKEMLDTTPERQIYSDEELKRINRANAERKAMDEELEKLQRSLQRSARKINGTEDVPSPATAKNRTTNRADEIDSYSREIEEIQNRALANSRRLMGLPVEDRQSSAANGDHPSANAVAGGQPPKGIAQDEQPAIVEKVISSQAAKFNTIGGDEEVDAALIKAMIDQTTKAQEGTRLRFKLLDDVTIDSVRLKKGTYLYGIVTGFGKQRVKANVESILVGDRFIKVYLSVYDNDGMEGFYVPQSAFRDFVKNAGATAAQQSIQMNNSSGSLNAESVALQALQNIYTSASNAVSSNIRKNKARIKYNSIVYLINSKQ